jgi:hypothetical protein
MTRKMVKYVREVIDTDQGLSRQEATLIRGIRGAATLGGDVALAGPAN